MSYSLSSRISKQSVPRRVVLFGDSITDVNGGPRLDGSIESNYPNGYWTWASIFCRKQLRLIVNSGVSGNNTTNMLARIKADVLDYKPDIVVVFGGVNDCSGVSSSGTRITAVATAIANLAAIYSALEINGIIAVAVPIWPVSSFVISSTHARQAMSEINLWIRQQATTRKNVVLADMGASFGDRSTNNEILYTNNGHPDYTTDGLHPGASGAIAAGRVLADSLQPFLRGSNLIMPYDDSANLLTNPALLGASGTAAPTSWDWGKLGGSGDATFSYVARTDGLPGNWLSIAMSGSQQYTFQQTVTPSTAIASGDQFVGMLEYEQTATSGSLGRAACLDVDIRQPNAASAFRRLDAGTTALNSGGVSVIVDYRLSLRSGVLETPVLTAPVGAVGGFIQYVFKVFGDGTFNIGRVSLVKIN